MNTLDMDQIQTSNSLWFRVCALNIDLPTAKAWFEQEGRSFHETDLIERGWTTQFECGLALILAFAEDGAAAQVYATEPIAQHAARHLRHWRLQLTELSAERHLEYINRLAGNYPELQACEGFQLWRQGDDGNEMKIGYPTSERDVNCWQKELESHQHRQIYWSARVE